MRNTLVISFFMIAAITLVCIIPASAAIPAGATGWIAFKTNVAGVSVYINGVVKGTTDASGEFDIPYDNTYTIFTVKKDFYYDTSGPITPPAAAGNSVIPVTMTPLPPAGGRGFFTVHSNVNGGSVYLGGDFVGIINSLGFITVDVSTSAPPYTSFTVNKSGYNAYTGSIPVSPGVGETIDLYATLSPLAVPSQTTIVSPTLIGGSVGYYAVHCNVDGASVSFDNDDKGQIVNGVLLVTVYTTGTPYKTYTVSLDEYDTATGALPAVPSAGQTQNVYVTLNKEAPETPGPIGSALGTIAVYANVEGAKVYFDDDYQGAISNGVLMDSMRTRALPYRTYRVEAPGYATATGPIREIPNYGEIITLHVTLGPASPPTPTPGAPLPAAVTIAGFMAAVGLIALRRKEH